MIGASRRRVAYYPDIKPLRYTESVSHDPHFYPVTEDVPADSPELLFVNEANMADAILVTDPLRPFDSTEHP